MPTTGHTAQTEQRILNDSKDSLYDTLAVTPFLETTSGSVAQRATGTVVGNIVAQDVNIATASGYAVRIVISGTDIYVGKAAIGSAAASAVWQAKKIDTASDIIITWADGNANFDNAFDSPAGLSYS